MESLLLALLRVVRVSKGWFYSSTIDSTRWYRGLSFSGQVDAIHTAQALMGTPHELKFMSVGCR